MAGVVGLFLVFFVLPILLFMLQGPVDWEKVWALRDEGYVNIAFILLFRMPESNAFEVQGIHYLFWPVFGLVMGLCVGIAQGRVLKRYFPKWKSWLWWGLSAIGASIGLLTFLALQFRLFANSSVLYDNIYYLAPPEILNFIPDDVFDFSYSLFLRLLRVGIFAVSGGAIFGFAQWLVLRKHIPNAGWWILANVMGWGAGGFVLQMLYRFKAPADLVTEPAWVFMIAMAYVLICLVLIAAVTGGALVFLRRSSSLLVIETLPPG